MTRVPLRSKYHARPTVVDNVRFASKAEARRYRELCLLQRAGEIQQLELQPRFRLVVGGVDCGAYVGDFLYVTKAGVQVLEDVKGTTTPVYRLKKKLVEALYAVRITEVA